MAACWIVWTALSSPCRSYTHSFASLPAEQSSAPGNGTLTATLGKMQTRRIRALLPVAAAGLALSLYSAVHAPIRGFDSTSQAVEVKWEQAARAIPESARVRRVMEKLASQPHLAGTPQSKETAESLLEQLREFGLEAHIERYEALLPHPRPRFLELTGGGQKFPARLAEPPIAVDKNTSDEGMVPGFNAYSG